MPSNRLAAVVLLVIAAAAVPARAGYISGPAASSFSTLGTKWKPGPNAAQIGGFGTPGSATFSIMGAGLKVHADASGAEGGGHGAFTTLSITGLGVSGFTAADYANVFHSALNLWDAASGFTNLGQVADGAVDAGAPESIGGHLGDIRIAAWEILASGTLAHAFQPGTEAIFGPGGTIAGDVHFDVNRHWVDEAGDTTADSDFDLFTVALHELGHALGLGHSTVSGSVMEAHYAGSRRVLTADDIAGIQLIYGPPQTALIPEPSSVVIWALGALGLVAAAWRRRRRAA